MEDNIILLIISICNTSINKIQSNISSSNSKMSTVKKIHLFYHKKVTSVVILLCCHFGKVDNIHCTGTIKCGKVSHKQVQTSPDFMVYI